MHRMVAVLAGSLVLVAPVVASAQSPCDKNDWFCEDAEESEGEAFDEDADDLVEEAEEPPVVVYERKRKPARIVVVDRVEDLKPPKPRRKREWGLNLRLEGVMMGSDESKHPRASMSGLGFSLRYRPVPHFAFDVGVDFLGGTDWNGYRRSETAVPISGIVFFNPRDRFQIYTIGGISFSGARVDVEPDVGDDFAPFRERYSYFGGHLGIGAELRVGRKVALNVDLVGFVRGRTDVRYGSQPEFIDPETNRATNSSGGGLLRGGLTFYW